LPAPYAKSNLTWTNAGSGLIIGAIKNVSGMLRIWSDWKNSFDL